MNPSVPARCYQHFVGEHVDGSARALADIYRELVHALTVVMRLYHMRQ